MKNISKKIAALLVVPAVVVSMGLAAVPVSASLDLGIEAAGGTTGEGTGVQVTNIVGSAVNWLLYAIGVVAVIMLIWGGIKYATSAGDSSKVTSAKNTILYAVIGLAVAVLAYAIVNLVVNSLRNGTLTGPS